jgi:hypothetical protein
MDGLSVSLADVASWPKSSSRSQCYPLSGCPGLHISIQLMFNGNQDHFMQNSGIFVISRIAGTIKNPIS